MADHHEGSIFGSGLDVGHFDVAHHAATHHQDTTQHHTNTHPYENTHHNAVANHHDNHHAAHHETNDAAEHHTNIQDWAHHRPEDKNPEDERADEKLVEHDAKHRGHAAAVDHSSAAAMDFLALNPSFVTKATHNTVSNATGVPVSSPQRKKSLDKKNKGAQSVSVPTALNNWVKNVKSHISSKIISQKEIKEPKESKIIQPQQSKTAAADETETPDILNDQEELRRFDDNASTGIVAETEESTQNATTTETPEQRQKSRKPSLKNIFEKSMFKGLKKIEKTAAKTATEENNKAAAAAPETAPIVAEDKPLTKGQIKEKRKHLKNCTYCQESLAFDSVFRNASPILVTGLI